MKFDMRTIFILLFVFSGLLLQAQAGHGVSYHIDYIQPDSFYLIESIKKASGDRPDISYTLFRDTAEYRQYVQGLKRDQRRLELQYVPMKETADSLKNRVQRLSSLGVSKLGMDLLGNRPANSQAPPEAISRGFWVIYPPNTTAEYIQDESQIVKSAIILNDDGTTREVIKPARSSKKVKLLPFKKKSKSE